MNRILPYRRATQIGTALFMAALPFANSAGFHRISGNFLSFDLFGLPLADPLASAQAAIGSLSAPAAALAGAGLALLPALCLGRVFCSWLCPYGLFSELVFSLRGKTGVGGRSGATSRLLIAGLGLLGAALILPGPYLNQISLPGWYSRAAQHAAFYGAALWGVLLIPAVLALEFAAGKRLWCRYVCPQSVLIGLAAALPAGLRLRFAPKKCACRKDDRACLAACSLNLNPRRPDARQRLECTACGDCVDACRARGRALSLSVKE